MEGGEFHSFFRDVLSHCRWFKPVQVQRRQLAVEFHAAKERAASAKSSGDKGKQKEAGQVSVGHLPTAHSLKTKLGVSL